MGGGESKPAPPPVIVEEPMPSTTGITNLSVSSAIDCPRCDIAVDTRITTSSVKLTREFGAVAASECKQYAQDYLKVQRNEMSFQDFFAKVQSASYTIPVAETENGQFCRQVMFSDDDAASINSLAEYAAKFNSIQTLRIRQVTGAGGFSSGTKAKYKLSLPVRFKYVADIAQGPGTRTEMRNVDGNWAAVTIPTDTPAAIYKEVSVTTMTVYHPSPLRIENVQHDAVLSLNDPSDPSADAVILIPLKGSNLGTESESFLNKIIKHVISISTPDSISGLYQQIDIPTGNDWNIKQVLWNGPPQPDGFAQVEDALYSWSGSTTYKRKKLRTEFSMALMNNVITYGWVPDGKEVRYFMLGTPVSITMTDLSLLTRNLPPTVPEEAIHTVPDPAVKTLSQAGNKLLYRKAQGKAAESGCGIVRERMENSPDFMRDVDRCDPFAMNASNPKSTMFSPVQIITIVFNILLGVAVLVGAWIAMYCISIDYDAKYKGFAQDTGKVVGTLAKQLSGRVSKASNSIEGLQNLASSLIKPPGLGSLASSLGKSRGLGSLASSLSKTPGAGSAQ